MEYNNYQQQNECKKFVVPTTLELWKFITQKNNKSKFDKAQAFCHLMECQQNAAEQKEEYMLAAVNDFAKIWRWDRDTVSKFLTQLETIGVLASKSINKRKVFKLVSTTSYDTSG